jgi:hypothetical protein
LKGRKKIGVKGRNEDERVSRKKGPGRREEQSEDEM